MNSSGALTSVRLVLAMAPAALIGGFGLAAPAAAHVSAQPAADAYWTTGRLVGSVAALVALAGVIIGGLALARPTSRIGTGNGRLGATMALVAGLTGIALGGLVVAAAEGGPGTGYGIVGGFVALVIGLIATVLGWLALARSRRTG
ncbi:MAG TPA: hypothetical protein DGT23_20360 [Micromonosporaceae bacterium]|nr:hypothetical protein [Micromonosporaceae bacterium]